LRRFLKSYAKYYNTARTHRSSAKDTRGCVDLGMPKQDLDQMNLGFLLQQVGGEAMPQRVRRHPLLDLGHVGGGMNGAVELARRQRQQPITARELPHRRPRNAIPIA
jgi:hypothetical protein